MSDTNGNGADHIVTRDLFEAATMRALGARLVEIRPGHPGEAVIDLSTVTIDAVQARVGRLRKELARIGGEAVTVEAFRGLIDNTLLAEVRSHYFAMKDRVRPRHGGRANGADARDG